MNLPTGRADRHEPCELHVGTDTHAGSHVPGDGYAVVTLADIDADGTVLMATRDYPVSPAHPFPLDTFGLFNPQDQKTTPGDRSPYTGGLIRTHHILLDRGRADGPSSHGNPPNLVHIKICHIYGLVYKYVIAIFPYG
ncbi:MAG: hypothetical protein MPJ22_02430 [Pirellulales bacterium]|nr:hypothetical protein [Pirellulales bacterium]